MVGKEVSVCSDGTSGISGKLRVTKQVALEPPIDNPLGMGCIGNWSWRTCLEYCLLL